LGIRAEDMTPKGHSHETARLWEFSGIVNFCEPLGSETLLITDLSGQEVVSKMYRSMPVQVGQNLVFEVNLNRLHIFDSETGVSQAV
jgi:multiple sugar transport system ATP-binding protein